MNLADCYQDCWTSGEITKKCAETSCCPGTLVNADGYNDPNHLFYTCYGKPCWDACNSKLLPQVDFNGVYVALGGVRTTIVTNAQTVTLKSPTQEWDGATGHIIGDTLRMTSSKFAWTGSFANMKLTWDSNPRME